MESLEIHSPLESWESPTLGFSLVCSTIEQSVQVHVEDAWLMYLLLFGDPKLCQSYVQRGGQSLLFWLLDVCGRQRLPGVLIGGGFRIA